MRAHVAELLGTFALVFFGCGAIAQGLDPLAVAIAFGLVVGVLISALGHLSGAHFNPAVSVGLAVGGHIPWSRVATYSIAQIAGALAGAALIRLTLGDVPIGVTHPSVSPPIAIAWEAVMTALLVVVISAVATDARAAGQRPALAIGGVIGLSSIVGGPVSGASLNPARSLGPAVVSGDLADLWIYFVGPIAGAVVGALLYRYLRNDQATA